MSNIEYLRQLHHKIMNLKRTRFHVKEFYSYGKDLVFSVLRKGLDLRFLHILRSRKELGLCAIYNAW